MLINIYIYIYIYLLNESFILQKNIKLNKCRLDNTPLLKQSVLGNKKMVVYILLIMYIAFKINCVKMSF